MPSPQPDVIVAPLEGGLWWSIDIIFNIARVFELITYLTNDIITSDLQMVNK